MKKNIKLIILIIVSFYYSKAQNDCATITPTIDFINSINPSAKLAPLNAAIVQLYFHIVRRNNGTGNLAISDVLQGFNSLQYQFNAQNICFTFFGYDYIDDTDLFKNFNSVGQENSLISNNPHSDAIDIYIITDEGNTSGVLIPYAGNAIGGIGGKTIIVTRQGLTNGSTTLAHELGHCLGLYHTFETQFCSEAINGSNSSTCGDLVVDTPADNNWGNTTTANTKIDGSCNYTGGMGYSPLTNNIMSYYSNCRTSFTNDQGIRMRTTIANSSVLQQCLPPTDLTITQTTPLSLGTTTIYSRVFIAKNKVQTFSNFIVNEATSPNITSVGLVSENEIEMLPGFVANEGANFAALIAPICPVSVAFKSSTQNNENYIDAIFSDYYQTNQQYPVTDILKNNVNRIEEMIFNIIPNPNNGTFKLTLNNNNELPKTIVIRDALGKEVKTIQNPTEYEYNFNLNELSGGLYIINGFYTDKTISTRFIKN